MKKTTTAVVATLAALALGSTALATMDIQKEYKAKDAEGQLRHLPRREDAEEGQAPTSTTSARPSRPPRARTGRSTGRRSRPPKPRRAERFVSSRPHGGCRAPGPRVRGRFSFRASGFKRLEARGEVAQHARGLTMR